MMAYDYSHSGTEPGPVAPLWWVEENIEYMLKMGLPPEKLSLGIATYGYDWLLGGRGATARGNVEIKRIVEQYRAQVNWDQENQVPVIDYSDPEVGEREIWFENNASIKRSWNWLINMVWQVVPSGDWGLRSRVCGIKWKSN